MPANTKTALLLGGGYTGRRVARKLLARGVTVSVTSRDPGAAPMQELARAGAKVLRLDVCDPASLNALENEVRPGSMVLHSLPAVGACEAPWDPTPRLLEALGERGERPRRVVYLSTTGVYGAVREVNETTPPAPVTERQKLRLAAERAVAGGPWPSLILRPAAIYGPGRGVHVRLREGTFRLLGDGSNFVSRIHVDDLADIALAALLSDRTGAYPVADDEPCPSREIVAFCAELLGLAMPPSASPAELDDTRRSDRRVDGSMIRRLLGVELSYPSYRVGIPAALASESAGD